MSATRKRRAAGFTLIEALLALAIFAVGVTALVPLAVTQIRANDDASTRTEALALAQEQLEMLRAVPFANLQAGNDVVRGVFNREWVFIPTPALAGDEQDLTRIRVTVKWQPLRGQERSVTLVTSRAI